MAQEAVETLLLFFNDVLMTCPVFVGRCTHWKLVQAEIYVHSIAQQNQIQSFESPVARSLTAMQLFDEQRGNVVVILLVIYKISDLSNIYGYCPANALLRRRRQAYGINKRYVTETSQRTSPHNHIICLPRNRVRTEHTEIKLGNASDSFRSIDCSRVRLEQRIGWISSCFEVASGPLGQRA